MIYFSRIFSKPRKNTCELVGTVLKMFLILCDIKEFAKSTERVSGRVMLIEMMMMMMETTLIRMRIKATMRITMMMAMTTTILFGFQ